MQAATQVNAVQTSKRTLCGPTWESCRGRLIWLGVSSEDYAPPPRRGSGGSMYTERAQHGKPLGVAGDGQLDAREGQARRPGVAERSVLLMKLGNASGGKGPQFKTDARRGEGPGDWAAYQLRQPYL